MYWVKIQIILNILAFSVNVANTEECVSSTQCSDWEICRNDVCEDALHCGVDADPCAAIPGFTCVSDYCQPSTCTSTGQCVHGHVCSQDKVRRCVYPIVYNIEEISEFTLQFQEPATPGRYEELYWYKGGRSSLDRLAIFHHFITDNKPQYYGDFCSGNSPCDTSDRAHLNIVTGELTINSVKFSDEGFYYYQFYVEGGTPDTGNKYEYKLTVYDCDNSSDVTQCSAGEICRNNRCEDALYCRGDTHRCASISGLSCSSDYCQPTPCTSTAQCVYGHVCSQDTNRRCVFVPDLTIEGVPENYVEVGTYLFLTCTAKRIKPEPLAMYWEINGINMNGNITTKEEDGDGIFTCTSYFVFTVAKEDANRPITCVVVPVHSDAVTMETTINTGYAPTGKPVIQVSTMGEYKGKKVSLTCENPMDEGNPPCNTYDWIKPGRNISNLPNTKIYTFIMDEFHAGNYTCRCSNQFGESEVSDEVEIVYLGEKLDVGLIAGCVVGGLVLVAMVIVAVIICRKYKINFNIDVDLNFKSRKDGEKNTRAVNTVDSNGYENPVASQSRARSIVNEYAEINEGAMVRTRQEGYVNVTMTTYEDLL